MITYQNAIVTYGRLAQIAANQQLMETQLSTIASNSALLSSATTACATEINVVFGLYQTNAESLAQVAKLEDLRSVLQYSISLSRVCRVLHDAHRHRNRRNLYVDDLQGGLRVC